MTQTRYVKFKHDVSQFHVQFLILSGPDNKITHLMTTLKLTKMNMKYFLLVQSKFFKFVLQSFSR